MLLLKMSEYDMLLDLECILLYCLTYEVTKVYTSYSSYSIFNVTTLYSLIVW